MSVSLAIFAILGLGISTVATLLILALHNRVGLPERSPDLHHADSPSVPRLGGLALAIAFLAVELVLALVFPEKRQADPAWNVVVLSCAAMFLLGFSDDIRPLDARVKLLGQIGIAVFAWFGGMSIQVLRVPFTGFEIQLGGWSLVITVLWLVGMTNLVNLMDGVDGLAGGLCLMPMALLAVVGQPAGAFDLLAAGMVGALLGFLWFNFPPARIYLGDGGAYLLGFLIGLISLSHSRKGTVFAALATPLFVLAFPLMDTTLAILRRGLSGLPLFRPDRWHIHHRLLRLGFSPLRIVLALYAFTLVNLGLALMAFWSRGEITPILGGLAMILLLLAAMQFRWNRNWNSLSQVLKGSLAMRKQVQYTLSLTRWLEFEGKRHRSLVEFWPDFTFALSKLGFVSATVTMEDGRWVWRMLCPETTMRSVRYDFRNGHPGVLELGVPVCPFDQTCLRRRSTAPSPCPVQAAACLADARVSEVIADLIAEAWVKAVVKLSSEPTTAKLLPRREPNRPPASPGRRLPRREPVHP